MILPKSSELSDALRLLARAAGDLIMTYYNRPIVARAKPDASPVTDADEAAERLIVEGLRSLAPDIPIVAEGLFAAGNAPEVGEEPFWLVDPLPGPKEFSAPTGHISMMLPESSEVRACSTNVPISMCSPRPMAPNSATPATSVIKRMHRVQWMHRVRWVLISGPKSLSVTARLCSE